MIGYTHNTNRPHTKATQTMLTLAHALRICEGAVSTCLSRGFAPITIVVVDANGHQIAAQRMDGCQPMAYPKFAAAKAHTCVSLGVSSRQFRDKYTAAKVRVSTVCVCAEPGAPTTHERMPTDPCMHAACFVALAGASFPPPNRPLTIPTSPPTGSDQVYPNACHGQLHGGQDSALPWGDTREVE